MSEEKIILTSGNTSTEILPRQGAVVSRFVVGNQNILFPQGIFETEKGPKRRGGLPLLFPNANPITEEQNLFKLPQHGFARDLPWEVANQIGSSTTLKLTSTLEIKEKYPFDFELELKIEIRDNFLKYLLTIYNKSGTPLPVTPGLHPYFYIPITKKRLIKTNIRGFDPSIYDFSKTLFFPGQETVEVKIPDTGKIIMKSSSEFKVLAIWSEPNRDHVCFEPWVGPTNAILHPNERINILPGQDLPLFAEISFSTTC